MDGGVFRGGQDFEISMEFRTDQLNSLLIFTHNKYTEDFMLVRSSDALTCKCVKGEIVIFGLCIFRWKWKPDCCLSFSLLMVT